MKMLLWLVNQKYSGTLLARRGLIAGELPHENLDGVFDEGEEQKDYRFLSGT
jgi:hypothetical protein